MKQPLVPKGNKGRLQQLTLIYKKPDFLVTWIIPLAVFNTVLLLFTYGFMQIPSVCIIVACCFGLAGLVLLALRHRGHVWFPLGMATLVAVLAGSVLGLFVYDTYACFPQFYSNSRTYTNLVPSQPSGAVADAGGITFSAKTFVDIKQSSGFISEAGYVYCAAPILDDTDLTRIEYWAVGVDCCGSDGSFACDQSGDESAQAGIRVFDNSGWFMMSNHDFYVQARKKAEAAHALVSVESPIYLRWVREENLNMLSNYYRGQAALCVFGLVFLYLLVATGLSFALYRPRPARPKAQWPGPESKAVA